MNENMLLHELIERNARRAPFKEAIVAGGTRLNYAELQNCIDKVAQFLTMLGICPGEKILVQMKNLVSYVVMYFAVPKLAAILVPVNVRLTPDELRYLINHSEAVCIIADLERAFAMEKSISDWGRIRERIVVGGSLDGWHSYEELISRNDILKANQDRSVKSENDVAYIYYTSGTTGRPKGVMWTHRQVVEQIHNLQTDLPLRCSDASIVAVNMSHGPSLLPVLHHPLFMGGRIILYEGPKFRAEEFASLAIKEGAHNTLLVPTMLIRLLELTGSLKRWYESFKYIKYVGARMDQQELWKAVRTMHAKLSQGYGSTETVGGITVLLPSEHDPAVLGIEKRLTSVGKEYTCVDVTVMDDDGKIFKKDEVGEICVKSDKIFKGYWRDADATKKVFREGWFLTGDLGRFDGEGYLYIVDRISDMIISGGENVYPQEIETLLINHANISDIAIVGIPDRQWGELVCAFVVERKHNAITIEEIAKFCKGKLAPYKIPRRVVNCESLPKNYLGKTQKYLLRESVKDITK